MKSGDVNEIWRAHPLCRAYRIVVLTTAQVRIQAADGLREHRFGWALGFLPNKEAEVLGLWAYPALGSEVARNLYERGVERIALLVDAGWPEAASEVLKAYPRAHRLQSTEHFIRTVSSTLRHRRRVAFSSSVRVVFDTGSATELQRTVQEADALRRRPAMRYQSRLLPEAQRLSDELFAHSEHDRCFVLAADRTASVLLEELERTVRKNGYFLNHDAAVKFIEK